MAAQKKGSDPISRIIRKGARRASLFKADLEFHQCLVSRCGNPALMQMIETARAEIQRWDGGTERGMADPEKAYQEHAHIIARLAEGKKEQAAQLLEAHWNSGVGTVST